MDSASEYLRKRLIHWKLMLWILPITGSWLILWFWPWQKYLEAFIWLKVGIGLFLFILPGTCIYDLITRRSNLTFSHITFGFVISNLIFALLGMFGRLIHLSFEIIKLFMVLMGLIPMLVFVLAKSPGFIKVNIQSIKVDRILPLLFLLLVACFACLIVIQRVHADDDLTYLAFLTNWQHSSRLDFNDVLFGKQELVHPRFWIVSTPLAQALLADISKVPGIVMLSGYYEAFLVMLAVLSWYEMARALTLSRRAASASSISHVIFLMLLSDYLHPGASFINQLSTDKATAAFILAPVFFQSLIHVLKRGTKSNLIIFILAGFSLTFMHPVILAYSVFIGGVLVLFNWMNSGSPQKILMIIVLVMILLPQAALRFANGQSQKEIPYTTDDILSQSGVENMVTRWGETQFYGFNPTILDMHFPFADRFPLAQSILARGWLVFPIVATAKALRQARRNFTAQFLVACFLLAFLAWLPFTGWIIGYFLSAYMLERALWLFPFGLSSIYVMMDIRNYSNNQKTFKKNPAISSYSLLLAVTAFVTGIFSLYFLENQLPDIEKFTLKSQRYQGLAEAGQELDRRITGYAYVVGSPQINDLIPGVSSKSKILTFRISQASHMQYFSPAEREERIADTQKLFSKSLSPEEKMLLLEKYDVQFLFLQSFDLRLFEDFIAHYPDKVEVIETGGVILLQIKE